MYEWQQLYATVSTGEGKPVYGRVNRGGRTFFRRYKTPLKNGKGLTLMDIMRFRIEQSERFLAARLQETSYGR